MFQERRGCLALTLQRPKHDAVFRVLDALLIHVPKQAQENRQERDGSDHHITIATASEWKGLTQLQRLERPRQDDVDVLGLGQRDDVYFAVCNFPAADEFRKSLGLDSYNFHITLGFASSDVHDVDKSVASIRQWASAGTIESTCSRMCMQVPIKTVAMLEAIARHAEALLESDETNRAVNVRTGAASLAHAARCRLLRSYMNAKLYDRGEALAALLLDSAWADEVVDALYVRSRTRIHLGHDRQTVALSVRDDMDARRDVFVGPRGAVPLTDAVHFVASLVCDLRSDKGDFWALEACDAAPAGRGGAAAAPDDGAPPAAARFAPLSMPFHYAPAAPGLAGSGAPGPRTVRAAVAAGFTVFVTLTEDPLSDEVQSNARDAQRALARLAARGAPHRGGGGAEAPPPPPPLQFVHLPIPDLHAPKDAAELLRMVEIVDAACARGGGGGGGGVLVHCKGGKGRTVMVLAGVLMLRGECATPSEAMGRMKAQRIVSTTAEQNTALKDLFGLLCERRMLAGAAGGAAPHGGGGPSPPPPPPAPMTRFVMLCGLPCGGKTSFVYDLVAGLGARHVAHICQDELGRAECEREWGRETKRADGLVFLDRCNHRADQRREWLALASCRPAEVTCLFFDLGAAVSVARSAGRPDHPTLPSHRAPRIIAEMAAQMERPTDREGFGAVVVLRSPADVDALLARYGVPPHRRGGADPAAPAAAGAEEGGAGEEGQPDANEGGADADADAAAAACSDDVIPFPRTRHLLNLGAATSDDVVERAGKDVDAVAAWAAQVFLTGGRVVLEEKVDGANMGLRIMSDGRLAAQNRSHFVNAKSHEQFKRLDWWVQEHEAGLRRVLRRPGRVLYGEWLYMKHSVHYTRLPDVFMAFDLWDAAAGAFASRAALAALLEGTGILHVPLVAEFAGPDPALTSKALEARVATRRSDFCDGAAEGVYLRACTAERTVDRCKVVRNGFIAGNEHWTKGRYVRNEVDQAVYAGDM